MMTRTQLNLLGRRSYLSSVVALATSSAQSRIDLEDNDDGGSNRLPYSDDFEVNRKYLTLSWWLLNKGWIMARARLEPAVRRAFSHLSPRDEISLDTFAALTNLVRSEMEDAPAWLGFLLPPAGEEELLFRESGILGDTVVDGPPRHNPQVDASAFSMPSTLRRLIDETSDIVDSPPFSHVLTLLLDAGFAALLDGELAETVFAHPGQGTAPATVQLPKILSSLARQAHVIGGGPPNRYLGNMDAVLDLDAFAAVVYSSNWENELKEPTDCQAR